MNLRGLFAALTTAALLLSGLAPAANASVKSPAEKISGVLVQYAEGVNPVAPNGEPTGANFLRGQVVSDDLGGGLYVLRFSSSVDKEVAKSWIRRMALDRRIAWAQPNLATAQASVGNPVLTRPILTQARAASGPRSLVAKPAVSSSNRDKARIRLTWKTPERRYGAKIVGYRIQYSSNNGVSYQTLISDTGSDATRLFVSDGIRAGVSYRFRVRAITNDGSLTNTVGASSNTASASVQTAPKPVYITSAPRVGPGNITYLAQSVSDRGGFAANRVRYRAVATAADIESVETYLCNATRCRFPELLPDTAYTVEVFATNELGTSTSNAAVAVNDLYFPLQWYLNGKNGISMPAAWKYTQGDNQKVVAVIDTGIKAHQQINRSLTRNADGSIYGYDFVSDIASAADGDGEDPNPNDEGGDSAGGSSFHGTHVAGIIAAEHDFVGTAGVAPNVKVLPIRALGKDGGTIADLVKAVNWASGVKIDGIPQNRYPVSVINLSLGAKEPVPCTRAYSSIFEAAIARGITVVVAAGNEGRASLSFPGNCPGVITVVATQALGDRANYSNYGDGVLISAPGGEENFHSVEDATSRGMIISTWINPSNVEDYILSQGTSMAAPVVSGIVALMYSMQPGITPARVRSILQDSVRPFAPGSKCAVSGGCGAGIINAQLALARTSALK
jgi:serine protease